MTLIDDGDLIKGLGFVALYAAYLEEAIDECVGALFMGDQVQYDKIMRKPSSQKIEWIQDRLKSLMPLTKELGHFPGHLDVVVKLLEERNLVIHGRVYAVPGEGDVRYAGRKGIPTEVAKSSELYELANDLFRACDPLMAASMFAFQRLFHAKREIDNSST
ncbi:MAG TPA: hypothetical protein VLC92_14475 [Rhodocyclaceae bacterium]|nr:hypothetical protein [Rhodocyclaceae bacterium]